ncbi:glycosyl hydrolase family 95 catalytic domain-containing protein [Paenibacillus alkalitolerans]|uniref:glycosyl hydrolase family 95 catalytic domain-containing protein n=1 Tax=Paenibacillus alkalitolerans TaxID=2799335 RepID=UPI0018F282A3|nr:glycoside hydrolase N-terminal domain-containing protein [Paenibacillus alkalitolerans]
MKMRLKYPAAWWKNMWREALPSGNGTIGASVFGAVQEETVIVNHADLWHWGRKDRLPDVSFTLEETRKLMDERRYLEASWHLTNTLKQRGYETRLASRFPLAAIRLTMPCERAFRQYERSLNMETGEVTVSWSDGTRKYARTLFVSRADDCIVYSIEADTPAAVNGEIGLRMHPSDRLQDEPAYKELEQSVAVRSDGEFVMYAGRNDDGTDFGAVLRLVPDGGRITNEPDGLRFEGADRALAIVKVFVSGSDRVREWDRLKDELSGIRMDYQELLVRHTALHRTLLRSASLEIEPDGDRSADEDRPNEQLLLEAYEGEAPTELVRMMWAYGRYLFISGTGPNNQPFGLYGLWGGDYRLVWCHNMANENVQMMYWHAHVGGLEELTGSLFRYYESLMDDFRDNARKLYGCGGIYVPAGSTPGIGTPNQIVPVIMNWTGAAGWLASHFYEHYSYTGDERFLKETAWPFMREAIAFYEDFLVEGEGGYYKIYPSVSPENTPENFMPKDGKPLAHPMPTAINATMDFAILKQLLTSLIDASPVAGGDPQDAEKWKRMLMRIPPYEQNEDDAVREWMHPDFDDRYGHRHLSHLYPVFPGHEVNREEQPELFRSFETAVRLRKLGAQSGWSLAHMASIYARLGDGDSALECLDILSRSCLLPNLFTLHNDWRNMGVCMNMPAAPIQLDANMGWVNAVQEMLLYVSPKLIKLLPALPSKWRRGSFADWRFHTGSLSLQWDLDSSRLAADIYADRETELTVQLPEYVHRYSISGDFEVKECTQQGAYRVKMNKGSILAVRSQN